MMNLIFTQPVVGTENTHVASGYLLLCGRKQNNYRFLWSISLWQNNINMMGAIFFECFVKNIWNEVSSLGSGQADEYSYRKYLHFKVCLL